MKKAIILFAFFALFACSKESQTEDVINQDIKVNFTITKTDIDPNTKATVKTNWANEDVVFVFFKGVAAPKYLEMKYNASEGEWSSNPKEGMDLATDLASGSASADRKLTAIYLPYGSGFDVADSDGNFTIKDAAGNDYCGHFYVAESMPYTFKESVLGGVITLAAAAPAGSDKLVHFDVTGYTAGHTYELYQDYMKPLQITGVASDGTVNKNIGTAGDAIPGYIDAANSIVSFSGVLDESAVGSPKNYFISIRDTEDGNLYYRNATEKTISANQYIGLGNLTSAWTVATPGAFSVSATEQITFARSNLAYMGASGPEGKEWQLMKYPWSTIESAGTFTPAANIDFSLFGWATSGYNEKNPWMTSTTNSDYGPSDLASGETWPAGTLNNSWDWGINNVIYEYGGKTPAGSWRTPAQPEWKYVLYNRGITNRFIRGRVNDVNGLIIFPDTFTRPDDVNLDKVNPGEDSNPKTNGVTTYSNLQWNKMEAEGAVFLPRTGYREGTTVSLTVQHGYYWTNTNNADIAACRFSFHFEVIQPEFGHRGGKSTGFAVRLVRDLPAE